MFPFRTSSIFRSRWMALLWAAGIVYSAWSFAEDQPGPGNAADVPDAAQIAAVSNAF